MRNKFLTLRIYKEKVKWRHNVHFAVYITENYSEFSRCEMEKFYFFVV